MVLTMATMLLKLPLLVLLLASASIAVEAAANDFDSETHVQIPSAMLLHPHLFKSTLLPFRTSHLLTTRDAVATVDAVRIHDEFSHRDHVTGHVVDLSAVSSTVPNIVYLDLLPNVEAVQCTSESLEIFFLPMNAAAKASAMLTFGTKAKHYSTVSHVTGGNKFYCGSGTFVQRAVTSVTAAIESTGGYLSSIKLATRNDDQFMFANTDYNIVLNGSISVIPKATFFSGSTFSLSQAAARVFGGGSAASPTRRATCIDGSCFDSIFDSTNSRTSVDASSSRSFAFFMNYNDATKTARTPSITLDSRGTNGHNFFVTCIDCWAYISASVTFAASFQLLSDTDFPPAQFQNDNIKLVILYLRFSIDGRFIINFNQVAAYAATADSSLRGFPRKRSSIITQSPLNAQASAAVFPDPASIVPNPYAPLKRVAQQCNQLSDCLEALHARTSRLVQTPPTGQAFGYFKGGTSGAPVNRAYDNEVLLEPIFSALPPMENLLSVIIPFTSPFAVTSSLGLGVQNRWIPDETTPTTPIRAAVTQFSLEFGVQVTLDVKSDLFAFSKLSDKTPQGLVFGSCTRTQEYLIDPASTSSPTRCLAVFAEAGVKPSFIASLADMAPKEKTGNSQSHAESLKGICTGADPANNIPPTTVPPTWLTTPYVITRTSKLTAAFGFVGPTLRVSPADAEPLAFPTNTHTPNPSSYVNIATRNILLETELFPIMRTTIGSMELFAVPFVSTNIQIKFQPRGEPGPCDSASIGQLFFTAPLLVAHKVYQFVRIKSVSLQTIQSSSPSSCQAGSNCQVPFSGILFPPKCNTDLNIGYTVGNEASRQWRHAVFHPTVVERGLLEPVYNPSCFNSAAALDNDNTDPSPLMTARKAAYWDAAEKYYSACQYGRTTAGNGVGLYNPNVVRPGVNALNPDARYSNLYNILHLHNSHQPTDNTLNQASLIPSTYNPESFPSEIQFILPPALAASFPMCIRAGTNTPTGSVSATALDGSSVILPLSRTITEATGVILYNAFIRVEANALPSGSTVVATTAPGVSPVTSFTLPQWAELSANLNTLVVSASTSAGTPITRLPNNAIRIDADFSSASGVSGITGSRRLLALPYILLFCPKSSGCARSDWTPVSCGSSVGAGSASSNTGSACSINSGRVTIATPSFGTYYLAESKPGTAAPAAQVIAAAPSRSNPAPSSSPPVVLLTDELIAGIFFGGFGAGLLICGLIFMVRASSTTTAAVVPPAQPQPTIAGRAWSNQHSLEMQPQDPSRDSSFVASSSQRNASSAVHQVSDPEIEFESRQSAASSSQRNAHQFADPETEFESRRSSRSAFQAQASRLSSPGIRESSFTRDADEDNSRYSPYSQSERSFGRAANYDGPYQSPAYSRQGMSRQA